MKKYSLQILCLIFSMLSFVYFVRLQLVGITAEYTDYERFYNITLKLPFVLVNGMFTAFFILSLWRKRKAKWLCFAYFIFMLAAIFVDNHFYQVINHGQGG